MPTLYVVHCIDTEGPLYESETASLKRVETIYNINLQNYGISVKDVQEGNLDKLKDLSIEERKGIETLLSRTNLTYNSTWLD